VTRLGAHRAAGNRHLTEVEGGTAATRSTANHHQANLRSAQHHVAGQGATFAQQGLKPVCRCSRKNGHPSAASGLGVVEGRGAVHRCPVVIRHLDN
jgi:hypothetical protein